MEKIYMNDNGFDNNGQKNGQHKQKQKGVYHFSIVLSFVVAVMAIASLVVVGFNQISYAEPTTRDNFTMYHSMSWIDVGSKTSVVSLLYSKLNGATDNPNFSDPVFCIEHKVDYNLDNYPSTGDTLYRMGEYTLSEDVSDLDYQLLYIMNQSRWFGGKGIHVKTSDGTAKFFDGSESRNDRLLETYATQVAIWIYLYRTHGGENESSKHYIDSSLYQEITQAGTGKKVYYRTIDGDQEEILADYSTILANINKVIEDSGKTSNKKTVTVSVENTISEVKDTDYYQTSKISVVGNPSDDFKNYSISVSGIEGAFFVDGDGKKVENLTNLSPSQNLYIRIPKDKITKDVSSLRIEANGTFNNFLSGRKYVRNGSQSVVSVTSEDKVVPGYATIDLVGSSDTGMTNAQTIYFVGLIVLLCGVGIIYASTKPAKEI